MGNPNLKNRVIPNSAVDKELYDKLREYSKVSKVPISRLLDEAIEDLLIKRKAR
ncbi:MAG TPA: CopG family transcriptional regulator [Terrisporobacter glycolicus]|uniref:ribbon-helix-helix domain-containing protein n=1 Tax=Terrisporobacter TaxID=1505652 RepID=UPI000E9110BD|nr:MULTISPECIES: ribbon-helix-helix domain-containing protein [Terrisporobacter]HBI91156.1 CopG family transcriptional regulator [Terrisporobacter hibernicus]